MVRVALLLSVVWALTMIGGNTVLSWMTRGTPGWAGSGRGQALVFAIVVVWIVAFVAAARRAGAFGDLVSFSHRVADGDFEVRIAPHGPPALRAVGFAFNDMASRLAQQERQRRELMAEVAHELRTPLSVLQGRLEGMIDGVYPADPSQLEPLLEEARVLARIIEDLRTLANAESGVLTLERERIDAGMLVRDAVAAVRDDAARRQVAIAIDEEAGLAPANVDPVRIRQVVVNLLANAVRHSADGGTVTVAIGAKSGALTVSIIDRGAGIAPEELPKVFERFYKGPGSTGSGLGLTIARSFVRAHGGKIWAEGTPGTGTTFAFSVPA
jgi:two-component system OmpR family sensor kinase/two-component system sensor histidine kinase BaeS